MASASSPAPQTSSGTLHRRPSLSPTRSTRSRRPSSPSTPFHPPPRPERPSNPPEPPLTLLHPTTSRATAAGNDRYAHAIDDGDEEQASSGDGDGDSPGRIAKHPRHEDDHGHGHHGRRKVDSTWMPFHGMIRDLRARAPWYTSDWTDAWNYRVVPSTWFIFFANVLPGLAFSLDLIETTGQYGVQEVLLASFMAAFVASFFGAQPLLISGVTGPITVFNKTIYDIFHGRDDFEYLHFMGWVYLWAAILHWVAAILNAVKGLKYVTRFACDTFGFYVAAVYVQYGIQVVTRQFHQSSTPAAFLGILLAVITTVVPHYFNAIARSGYGTKAMRRFCADYGMPITIVAMTGFAYWGRFDPFVLESSMTLPTTSHSFEPASGRAWLVRFWQLPGKYVGIAFPFGIVLFILFYFDANVSSLIAQGSEFPLRKPAGFHWDFFLLGITTFIAGLLGVPAPNGLIPQAPLHTASLVVMGYDEQAVDDEVVIEMEAATLSPTSSTREPRGRGSAFKPRAMSGQSQSGVSVSATSLTRRLSRMSETVRDVRERRRALSEERKETREVPVSVVEQRVSNLAQGSLCLVLMTKPFEHVLGLIPKGVLAGLFWYMGSDALLTSGVTEKMLYLIRDPRARSPTDPLNRVRKSRIALFTLIELIGFGATFAITQTVAAIGFPIIIMLLVPVRMLIVPRLGFTEAELSVLDGPVASDFTMESVEG